MGIKITSQIGTDKGITDEAYIRIADYQISKNGSAALRLELYQSESDAKQPGAGMYGSMHAQARNQQIGETLWVALTKEVEEIVIEKQMVPVEITEEVTHTGPIDGEGTPTTVTLTQTRIEMQEKEVEVVYKRTVPDLSPVADTNIFAFGYAKLKAKLVDLFGEDSVEDC